QPVTVPEISEIRGVDSSGVIATLLDRKLITTAGRKAVIGRPILYKSTKEFLLRFGLKDVSELPSMEEFEKLVAESFQNELLPLSDNGAGDAAANSGEARVESESIAIEAEGETVSTEPRSAGENDPAA
ncbi:MAG: SMC-Scp complex subunit ScpB, partial [Terriglobales bacterium]